MAVRTVTIGGVDILFAGNERDHYFANVTDDPPAAAFFTHLLRTRLRPDAVVFDVGANLGLTAVQTALTLPRSRIFCFEPSPVAWRYLNETLHLNRLESRCRTFQLALGAAASRLPWFENPHSPAASHLAGDASLREGAGTVEVTTLDAFLDSHPTDRIDLIKIDVEGYDFDVIEGASAAIGRFRPLVFVEFNSYTMIAHRNRNPRDALTFLLDRFAQVFWFRDGAPKRIESGADILDFLHSNLIQRGCVDDLLCVSEA
jgi:FkbM family methyltransferase